MCWFKKESVDTDAIPSNAENMNYKPIQGERNDRFISGKKQSVTLIECPRCEHPEVGLYTGERITCSECGLVMQRGMYMTNCIVYYWDETK